MFISVHKSILLIKKKIMLCLTKLILTTFNLELITQKQVNSGCTKQGPRIQQ